MLTFINLVHTALWWQAGQIEKLTTTRKSILSEHTTDTTT